MAYLSVLRRMVMRIDEPGDQELGALEIPNLGTAVGVIEPERAEKRGDIFARDVLFQVDDATIVGVNDEDGVL